MGERRYLLIRADANAHKGTGHLMRCLALAQGWQAQGGQAIFITACESDGLRQRLSDEGLSRYARVIISWLNPEEIAEEFGHLTLAQVHAALTYYHANREEIESAIAADDAEADRLTQRHYQTAGDQV